MHEVIDNVLVLKVGTNTLMERQDDGSERLDMASFERIGKQVLALQEQGQHVVIVSSAAITAGMVEVGLSERPQKDTEMSELQRLASIGWRHVLNAWGAALGQNHIGELLLTRRELELEAERDEVLRVTHTLLKHGDIPVANENGAIAHQEIAFGDNDTLAAWFAAQLGYASLFGSNIRLMLLSDIDGVYADVHDPRSVIRRIDDIDAYQHVAGDAKHQNGTGGMTTKFAAARIAIPAGVGLWVANGRAENAIERALAGEIGTHFVAAASDYLNAAVIPFG